MKINNSTIKILLCIGIFMLAGCGQKSQPVLKSPNQKIKLKFTLNDGIPNYQVSYGVESFILASRLGLTFKNMPALDSNFTIAGIQRNSVNKAWQPVYGTDDTVRNYYREM